MGRNSLRQFLQNLCCDSPWDYAVFWRLQQYQSQVLLTWEDGSFNTSGPREQMGDVMDSFWCNWSNNGLSSSQSGNQTGSLADSLIAAMLAEMSNTYYVMGKGVVGGVVYSESPTWIFSDSIMAKGCCYDLTSECPDELLHQFAAGIKTLLLVPLVPFGVIELGSMDKVAENAGLVNSVKNEFDAHQQLAGYSDSSYCFLESLGHLSAIPMNKMDEDLKLLDSVLMPNTDHMMPMVQNLYQIYQRDVTKVTDIKIESKINIHSFSSTEIPETSMYPMFENSGSEMTQNNLRSSCVDEELEAISFFNDYEMAHHNMTVHEIMESCSTEGTMKWPLEQEGSDDTNCKSESQFLRFPSDCELHKALGSDLWDHMDLNLLQPANSGENSARGLVRKQDMVHDTHQSWGSDGVSTKDKKVEYLLEAVVGNASSISYDSSSNRPHSTTSSPKASSGGFGSPQTEKEALAGDDPVPWSSVTSAYTEDLRVNNSSLPSSRDCMISSLIEHQLQRDGNDFVNPKTSKPTGANKRRARPGDNHKPRPRDRQLIQDRIKELRELVPRSSKCSIDGLLDRAIKHMQFLRRVSDQADKIKQHLLEEGSGQKGLKTHAIKGSNQNGTSWALQLECDQQTCPIIVKDLEYPGHMLIEMLCNDHGRFLEIADVIHRLELTILKGVMEQRSDDSSWAYFIVQASGNFHRLDIFWPLMQLLQQNRTQISSKI